MPIQVYRVEHTEDRQGPYGWRASDWLSYATDNLTMNNNEKNERPLPTVDGLSGVAMREYFGFQSREGLLSWFGDYLDALDKAGFGVGVYKAPASRVRLGGHQVVFERSRAKLILTLTLAELQSGV